MNKEYPWKREDIISILEYATCDPYREDYFSCDYCDACRARIGNVRIALETQKEFELHEPDCPYILAKDMLTNIE